jgi:XTP/dITP diphosphohydrolase
LGDVLLQVILHARLGEDADEPFTIDDVAGDLVDKLIRRNPHVFADTTVHSIDEITENWERIKKAEKARGSAMDGIALAQPALSLAAKVLGRAARAGAQVDLPAGDDLGADLLALVARARAQGLDPEGALRRATLEYAEAVRRTEAAPAPAPAQPPASAAAPAPAHDPEDFEGS